MVRLSPFIALLSARISVDGAYHHRNVPQRVSVHVATGGIVLRDLKSKGKGKDARKGSKGSKGNDADYGKGSSKGSKGSKGDDDETMTTALG